MKTHSPASLYPFLSRGGEMGNLIPSIDWSINPQGPIDTWPQSLRTSLSIMLGSRLPMLLFWGPERICFCNDTYHLELGHSSNYPAITGEPGPTAWPLLWTETKPIIDHTVSSGEHVWIENKVLAIHRNGKLDDSYWTFSYSPVIDELAEPGGILITCIETTDNAKSTVPMDVTQEQLQFALEASELGTWVLDPVQNIVRWDTRCQELYGFPNDNQVAYADVLNHIHPDDRQEVEESVRRVLAPGSKGRYDSRFRTIAATDNKLRWLRCQGKAYFNEQKVAYRFAGTAQDITDQVLAQENLKRTEEQARLAVESAGAGTFFVDLATDAIAYSSTLATIFTGIEQANLTRDLLINYILPQDRPIRDKAYEKAAQTGKLQYEARTVWNDGSIHWLRVMGTYLNDTSGKARSFAGIAQDICAEVEARLEQQQFTSLVEGSPEYMSIFRLDGPVLYVNPYGLKLLGLTHDQLTFRQMSDFFTVEDWKIVQQEQIPVAMAQKQWEGIQHYRHFQTGERIPLDIKRFIIDDPSTGEPYAIVATGRDLRPTLAARKELEESEAALQKANKRLEMALNAGRLGSYELDLGSGLMQCTLQCRANFGLPADALFNFPDLLDVILPDDRQRVLEAIDEAIMTTNTYNSEYRINWPDGSIHWIRASGQGTYDEAGIPLKMVGITMDITTQRMAQQELERQVKEQTQELRTTNHELIRTNHELEQFAYIASHDLQEPLRKIQSFAGLLLDNRHDDELFTLYLNKVTKSAQRMSALIKAVLNYSRLSKTDEQLALIDLNQIIRNVLVDFELLIEEKEAVIQCENLPIIEGIPLQMHQLFTNLISNALKFSETLPVIVIQANILTPIEVVEQLNLYPTSTYVHLVVQDNGIGFEQEYADRVFTIFQRLNNAKNYSGTGIGLALCRKIVNNHGGIITAESEPGQGASFHIYLPEKQPVGQFSAGYSL
ncbi:PAS domain-containing protein [Spirosoma endbachense]|uniref:histidine kinase n=1 Tax=Spirosoma endbachense TaxID=2666025 RepID=A0A6P1VZ35_9BACT|nr:PAS domain-containing protein [Spirosoma endbachense]QHV97362.1 PAS domain-containing protein [Spirosoma endbachense]